ncbi:MAG: helix-turn-helix domain-containing protein [Dehalococcoidia bacterium]
MDAVQTLRRDRSLNPAERDRVEMVLSAAGWSPPRIAAHLACHPATVRKALKAFLAEGRPDCARAIPVRHPTWRAARR